MPSAWLIGPLVIKSSLVILIGSFFVGFVFFRLISPYSNLETKQRVDEIINILISFVIALVFGKILLNLPTFISDPIAILAYPSDSKAFYIAMFLTLIYVKFKVVQESYVIALLFSWTIVFLTASFVYEFIQMVWGGNLHAWGYLWLLVLLLLVVILLLDKVETKIITLISLVGWSLGQWVLAVFSTTTVFQFTLDTSFYLVILICTILLFISWKKQIMSGEANNHP